MKKLIFSLALVFSFLLINSGDALALRGNVSQIVATTTLDADPTSVSGTKTVKSAEKLAFFVTYDETEVGGISLTVTVDVSWDNSTWLDASFYDFAGGATLQTSESLTADGNYYFWLNYDLPVPYVRVVLAATGSDADDTAIVAAYMVSQE